MPLHFDSIMLMLSLGNLVKYYTQTRNEALVFIKTERNPQEKVIRMSVQNNYFYTYKRGRDYTDLRCHAL